jgi:S1-C subfamily serine protease
VYHLGLLAEFVNRSLSSRQYRSFTVLYYTSAYVQSLTAKVEVQEAVMARLVAALIVLTLASSQATPPKSTEADLIGKVRSSVVRIKVVVKLGPPNSPTVTPEPTSPLPPEIANCFHQRVVCLLGTGFFVNDSGDVVTAAHVAMAAQQVVNVLHDHGVDSSISMDVFFPNIEQRGFLFQQSAAGFTSDVVGIDREHDIAILRPENRNPFKSMPPVAQVPGLNVPPSTPGFDRISNERPRDGDDVTACGYPFGDPGLVTTTGRIASAWKSEVLAMSPTQSSIETYWLDVRINPGNSGGPLFRNKDAAVIGEVVQKSELNPADTNNDIGIVIPSKYISMDIR